MWKDFQADKSNAERDEGGDPDQLRNEGVTKRAIVVGIGDGTSCPYARRHHGAPLLSLVRGWAAFSLARPHGLFLSHAPSQAAPSQAGSQAAFAPPGRYGKRERERGREAREGAIQAILDDNVVRLYEAFMKRKVWPQEEAVALVLQAWRRDKAQGRPGAKAKDGGLLSAIYVGVTDHTQATMPGTTCILLYGKSNSLFWILFADHPSPFRYYDRQRLDDPRRCGPPDRRSGADGACVDVGAIL